MTTRSSDVVPRDRAVTLLPLRGFPLGEGLCARGLLVLDALLILS